MVLLLLQVFTHRAVETAFTASSAHDLAIESDRSSPTVVFSVSVAAPGLPLARAADLLEVSGLTSTSACASISDEAIAR